jgi:hypothetical protein
VVPAGCGSSSGIKYVLYQPEGAAFIDLASTQPASPVYCFIYCILFAFIYDI